MKKLSCLFLKLSVFSLTASLFFQSASAHDFATLNPLDLYRTTPQDIAISQDDAQLMPIESILFEGNERTKQDILNQALTLKVGEPFHKEDFTTTLQNLKNMQVFSNIRIFTYRSGEALKIKIELEEKWTLIPYLIFGSGGGTAYYALGLYDSNFIGRLYTFNFTYGCKNYNCSSVLFFRNPSLFGKRINFMFSPAFYKNMYSVYDKKHNLIGSFTNKQDMLISYADFQVNSSVGLGAGLVYQNNNIGVNGLSERETQNNQTNQFQIPASSASVAVEGRLTLGTINYDGITIDGVSFVSTVDSTLQAYKSPFNNYSAITNTVFLYRTVPLLRYSYFALRGNVSATSSLVRSQYYYLGGLDKIRGFFDGEFSGPYAWYANGEFRFPSYIGTHLALQHVVFSDAGMAAQSPVGMVGPPVAVSIGSGFRILFLNINKMALRFDVAYTLAPFHAFGPSFGMVQFF